MSYEKRQNKRRAPPSREKNIFDDIPITFETGNDAPVPGTSSSSGSSKTPTGIQKPKRNAGKDPLSISPIKDPNNEQKTTSSQAEATADDYYIYGFNMEDEEVPGGAMVFNENELDMEQAEIYLGDGQCSRDREQVETQVEDIEIENHEVDDFFEDRVRRWGWLGLPHNVLDKIKSDAELVELGPIGERIIDFQPDDDDEEEEGWETMSDSSDSSGEMDPDGDWEESLVYVEIDDLPSIQELFATQPDDFLRFQHRNKRHRPQSDKQTHSKLDLQFHNFTSKYPILQIGQRYFSGQWEETTGSGLFFRKNSEIFDECPNRKNPPASARPRPCEELKSIAPEPDIPFDPVFMKLGASYKNAYELVAVADKVLKLNSHIASTKKMPKTLKPGRSRLVTGGKLSVPTGYTARAILAGKYKPVRKYTNKVYSNKSEKLEKWKAIQGELTIVGEDEQDPQDMSEILKKKANVSVEEILS